MISRNWAFLASSWCYTALLTLYPIEFRARFGREMAQVFRDCCSDQLRDGGVVGLGGFWLRTLLDLVVSVPRERRRALLYAEDLGMRTGSLIDSIVLLAIIGSHLLMAGTAIALWLPHAYGSPRGFLFVAATIALALGGVAVAFSLILARFRQIHYRFIGL